MPQERHVRSRVVGAPAAAVFALLTDPARHLETEPGDWVRDALDPAPITGVGQVFGMDMYHEAAGGAYVMHNRVIAYEQDRALAWEPGQLDERGELDTGGWIWRYDLEPAEGGTRVHLTYDWSATPHALREQVGGMPPFGPGFLDDSLAALESAVGTGGPARETSHH